MFRILFASLFFVVVAAHAIAEKTRIAVIGAEATEPARSLLTAELSKRPDMMVLERAELEKVAGELGIQAGGMSSADEVRVGKLANADVLLLLSADEVRHLFTMRLIAVAPGVVLFEDSIQHPVPAPAEWASIAAKKLSPFLATFNQGDTPRIPLSILRIRAVDGGQKSSRLEKELGFLLSHRLMNEPSLWVLERSQMGLLEWENALKASPQSTFWTGSYIMDGSLTPDPTGIAVSVRLRSAAKGEEISLSAHAPDLLQLVEELAKQITASLKVDHPGAPWDMISEARQFYEEALWAFRGRRLEETSEASETAWALGLRNDTLALLRFHSEAVRLNLPVQVLLNDTQQVLKKPEPWMFECASLALDRLRESLAWKGENLSQEWVRLASDCLWDCSLVLRACYYASALEPGESESLKALRSRMRALCEMLKPASERFPIPGFDEKKIGFAPSFFGAPLNSLYSLRGIVGPLWQENAQDAVSQMKMLFDDIEHLPERVRPELKDEIIQKRGEFAPWIAYWNPIDRSRVPLAALRDALLTPPSPERAIDVALIMLQRRSNVYRDVHAGRFDADQFLMAILDVQTALWNARDALVRKEVSERRFTSAVYALECAEGNANQYSRPRMDAELEAFKMKLFNFSLSASANNPRFAPVLEPQFSKLSPEERLEILSRIREALSHGASPGLQRLEKAYVLNMGLPPIKSPLPSPAPSDGVLRPAWTVSEQDILGHDQIGMEPRIRYRQGRLYLLGMNYSPSFRAEPFLLFVYDPKTGATTRIVYPEKGYSFLDFELVNGELYVCQPEKVARYVPAENRWVDFPIPASGTNLFALNGLFYVAGQGIVTRLDPSTGKSEILASSRRRPALTILDDIAPYDITNVFSDSDGRLCVLLDSARIYRHDAAQNSWEEILNVERKDSKVALDRGLLLRSIGPDGFRKRLDPLRRDVLLTTALGLLHVDEVNPNRLPAPDGARVPGLLRGVHASVPTGPNGDCGAVFDGTALWLLAADSTRRKLQLKRVSVSGDPQRIIPLDIEYRGGMFWTVPMTATPEGIFFYINKTAYFFSKADLENWRQKP